VRLADAVLRGGHLSEQVLVDAVMKGDRPVHLDRCQICAERAVELGRWLDEVREVGVESSDAVFTPERLASQQMQIMRRLEQLDEPARVIAFPSHYRLKRETSGHRIAPAWVAVAAAAGIVLGLVSGRLTSQLSGSTAAVAGPTTTPSAPPAKPSTAVPTASAPAASSFLNLDLDSTGSSVLEVMDQSTPHLAVVPAAYRGPGR
jgi:hypothetical protein